MNRKVVTLTVVLIVGILMGVVGLIGAELYIEWRLSNQLNRSLPGHSQINNIDFDFVPTDVTLGRSRVGSDESPLATAEQIRVNPNLWSLFSDTIRIDEVVIEQFVLNIYRQRSFINIREQISGVLNNTDTSASGFNFLIERFEISEGRIRYFHDDPGEGPSFELSPVQLRLSPVDMTDSPVPTSVFLSAGMESDTGNLTLKGTASSLTSNGEFTGTAKLHHFNLRDTVNFFELSVIVKAGRVSGAVPLTMNRDGIKLERSSLELDGLLIDQQSRSNQPSASSDDVDTTVTTAYVAGSADTAPPVVRFDPLTLVLTDASYQYPTADGYQSIHARDGFIELAERIPLERGWKMSGGFEFTQPRSSLLFDANLTKPNGFTSEVLAKLTSGHLVDFNPYVMANTPLEFQRGTGKSAVEGTVSTTQLNLQVGVQLKGAKFRVKQGQTSGVLGIPTPTLLRYIEDRDGDLELSFNITGTPENPKVDIRSIRRKLLVNLGVDAAVLGTLGLPIFLGDKALTKVTGVSVINEVTGRLGRIFQSDDPVRDRVKSPSGTPIASPEKSKK